MKFKIASILELIIPLSVALMLSAFLGCGGGGAAYGSGSTAYDGTWNMTYQGFTYPAAAGTSAVACRALPVPIVIDHGFGTATGSADCAYTTANPTGGFIGDTGVVSVYITVQAGAAASSVGGSGVAATTAAISAVANDGPNLMTGQCISRVACQAFIVGSTSPGIAMFR